MIDPTKEEIAQGKDAMKIGDYGSAINFFSRAIEICPWDPFLRQLRAECYEIVGDTIKAIGDIRYYSEIYYSITICH